MPGCVIGGRGSHAGRTVRITECQNESPTRERGRRHAPSQDQRTGTSNDPRDSRITHCPARRAEEVRRGLAAARYRLEPPLGSANVIPRSLTKIAGRPCWTLVTRRTTLILCVYEVACFDDSPAFGFAAVPQRTRFRVAPSGSAARCTRSRVVDATAPGSDRFTQRVEPFAPAIGRTPTRERNITWKVRLLPRFSRGTSF